MKKKRVGHRAIMDKDDLKARPQVRYIDRKNFRTSFMGSPVTRTWPTSLTNIREHLRKSTNFVFVLVCTS